MNSNDVNNNLLISFIVPTYNGEYFLDLSLHSLLNSTIEKEEIFQHYEIIIINDGSKDNSYLKAKEIAAKLNKKIRKTFVKVINKENGQYGSVINRGIEEAQGKYFKVLDVDDTFNVKNLIEIIYILLGLKKDVDVIITDFTFEKALSNKQISYSWRKWFNPYEIIDLANTQLPNNIITMHSIMYRTDFLKEIEYRQIEGVYYSDSQYSLLPLINAKTLFYINKPLYKYYIGRNEQSINLNVMVKNRQHQKLVMDKIIDELLKTKPNSSYQEKYGWRIARNMFEWQVMLMSNDKSIQHKNKEIFNLMKDIEAKCFANPNAIKYFKKSKVVKLIKIGRGIGITYIIRIGAKLYARFKLNVMSDWDSKNKLKNKNKSKTKE